MGTQPITQLGPYQILGELGRGGMAIVYRAYQPALNRTVAIKVLPPHLAMDASFVQRFMQEARNAARLDHPNIVTIHDIGQANGAYYIVMQEAPGESLTSLIQREGRLPLDRTISILAQVASALDYAHAQGLIHRDIKPGNVIVSPDDKAMLTDFGIAKAVEGTRLTQTGAVIGTPEYMSPEQAKGEPVGATTDIYSLGIMLYEMLTGRAPFKADSTPAVLYKQVHEQPAPVRNAVRDLPAGVDGVLARALAKSPSQRFRTAGELVQTLRAVAAGQGAVDPSGMGQRKALWAALAVIAVAAVVVIALLAGDGDSPASAPTALVAQLATPAEPGIATQPLPGEQPLPDTPPASALTLAPVASVSPGARAVIRQVINGYAGPGRDYDRMGEFPAGEAKDIVGQDVDGGWWLVCCLGGEPVWIDAHLAVGEGDLGNVPIATAPLPPPTATAPPTPTPIPLPTATPAIPVLTITDAAVRVRSGPGTNYPELDTANRGQQFEISGRDATGGWWQIRFGGQTGWVSAQYVQAAGNVAALPVTAALPPPVVCSQPVAADFADAWTDQVQARIGCTRGPASVTDAAYEPFQRGAMIWRKDVLRHYVIADDGGWRSYADVWVEGLPDFSCPDIAPQVSPPTPVRGFGQVWCQNPDVRQRVGDAVEREWAERMTVQAFERGTMIRTNRGIYVLYDDGGWQRP